MPSLLPTVLLTLSTLGLGLAAGRATAGVDGAPEPFTPGGYTFEIEIEVPAPPAEAWDLFTGDVRAWWDHRFRPDCVRLEIGRQPGTSFVEVFDEEGNGAEHARVTHAVRGELLRMVGPLGLVGHGVEIDAHLTFRPAEEDTTDRTTVALRAFVHGRVTEATAAAVQGVWKHFLVDRYAPFVRGR
ncbi:MAG: hypothetical protein O2865_10955 [Planctomycetota bacterium]|nr:hypothetical protein [Planctomycetota bacterium]MDA0934163.1 hypothetical protein [Planctomycetota bacterium]